ncbi:exosortase A [Alkalimarinus alittae]|uniref:Exosortase n=1 Tax=Alkalimarinus alittae TaxID=2961619 RepID=A0ABY6MX03_9ALTE|nr:exosortase A [Alkalimarinus alittae]UZE94368.1 exosortase [Alkalimarinus alittae]
MHTLAVQKKTFLTLFVGFLSLFIYAYYTTLVDLWARWNKFDESYSHGILVLGISAFYLLAKFKSIPSLALKPAWFGVVLIFGSSVLWLLAYYASIEAIQQLLLPWLIWLFCYSLLGWNTAKHVIFPIGFLYFAIPFWDVFTVPLQYITTDINGYLLALVGVEAHIEDVFVTISVGKFEIAGGCSGLRYLIISITLTSLYSYLNFTRIKSAATLILIGILLALLANWIRVFIIILAGHVTHMESSLINEHDHFGWLVFAITLIPLFFIANKLERTHEEGDVAVQAPAEEPANQHSTNTAIALLYSAVAFVAAFAAPLYAINSMGNNTSNHKTIDVKVDSTLGEWHRSYLNSSLISPPDFKSPDSQFDAIYSNGENTIQLSIRSYIQQAPGKELINFNNRLYDQDAFITTSSGRLSIEDNDFSYTVIKNRKGQRELIGYQYLVSYMATSNRIGAKLLEVVRPLVGSPESTLIYTRIQCESDCNSEKASVINFIGDNYPLITHFKSQLNNH